MFTRDNCIEIVYTVKMAQLIRKQAIPAMLTNFLRKITKNPEHIKSLQSYIRDAVVKGSKWNPKQKVRSLDKAIHETAEAVEKGQAKPDLLASLFRERDAMTYLTDRSMGTELADVGIRAVREHPFLTGAATAGVVMPIVGALRDDGY